MTESLAAHGEQVRGMRELDHTAEGGHASLASDECRSESTWAEGPETAEPSPVLSILGYLDGNIVKYHLLSGCLAGWPLEKVLLAARTVLRHNKVRRNSNRPKWTCNGRDWMDKEDIQDIRY